MVWVDGFRLGNTTSSAFDQSKYFEVSSVAQKSRSSSSFLNFGIALNFFFINPPFFFIHVSCRCYPYFCASFCKNYRKLSVSPRLSPNCISRLNERMLFIISSTAVSIMIVFGGVYLPHMARSTSQFVCQQCGFSTAKWVGKCPNCGVWNSMVETPLRKSYAGQAGRGKSLLKAELVGLATIKKEDHGRRTSTKIAELDRVLGGGIVPGMAILLAGEPGIGKSTLLLQIADKVSNVSNGNKASDAKIIYVAGEESATQIAGRAARLGVESLNIQVMEETDVDSVVSSVPTDAALVIVDSIQTLTTSDLTGTAGSVGQVRECANRLTSFAKANGVPMFIVGHVTKEGAIAGPRVLEHMVDTVLWFEGERRELLRIVRAIKNRFGSTDEVGIFLMGERGLEEVANPSNIFLGQAGKVSGSVITVVMEGTRPILVEVQALVSPTKLAMPRRSATGVDSRRLELIIAVLGRRVGIPLWDYDVFVNVAGGIRIEEPASDLAVSLAIASAFHDKPVSEGSFAVGEVGLLGEVREVTHLERRIKEAKRLGFNTPITAKEGSLLAPLVWKYFS